MTRARGRRGQRAGAGLVALGLAFAAGGLAAWQAAPVGAAELSSFDFRAGSQGTTFFNDDAQGARQAEGTVPYSESSLQSGPVGLGRSTITYPGPLAANAGSLLLVLQPGCSAQAPPPLCPLPPEAKMLNDPIVAEARSGQNPPTTTFDSVPGTELTATAEARKVSADARVGKALAQTGAFGATTTHTSVEQTANGGSAEGSSEVQDINLGGVIKIKAVSSTAKASTDGTKAVGDAATVVTGMTVGGQPAVVDENGFRIGTANQPANAVANQIAQQALSSGGFQVFVSTPQKEIDGANATVTAGSLIITQKSDSGLSGYILGGAQAAVTGAAGLGDTALDIGGDTGTGDGASFDSGTSSASGGGSTIDIGSTPASGPDVASPTAPSAAAGPGEVALGPTENVAAGGKPLKPAAVVFAMLGAGLLAIGMRRLSSNVLVEQAGTTCPLDEELR